MKIRKINFFVVLLFVLLALISANTFAGDKEDVQALVNTTAETFQ